MDGKAAFEILAKDKTRIGLATRNGFAVPGMRQGSTRSDHNGESRLDEIASRKSRRGEGANHRTGRSGVDGERLSSTRQDRGHYGNRCEIPRMDREELPRP